jgi:hypothetical protein
MCKNIKECMEIVNTKFRWLPLMQKRGESDQGAILTRR